MGQTCGVDHTTTPPARYLPGVVGTAGRFPVDVPVATPLVLAGHRLITPGPLRLYTCGITPYDVTHVGHASTSSGRTDALLGRREVVVRCAPCRGPP